MIVVAVIIYATWIPHPLPDDSLPLIPHIDKLIHAVMFGGFAGAMMFDYYRADHSKRKLGLRRIMTFAAIAGAFGVVDEVMQGLLNIGRPSDPLDLLADWAGIIVAAFTAPPVIVAIFTSGHRRQRP